MEVKWGVALCPTHNSNVAIACSTMSVFISVYLPLPVIYMVWFGTHHKPVVHQQLLEEGK